ncbi:MAG: hypothetical protein ABJF67_16925, partial [Aurantimonas coralicida]
QAADAGESPATAAAPSDGPEADAAPVKRRPGRPRKKKPEDGADGETKAGGDNDALPDFLLASNG